MNKKITDSVFGLATPNHVPGLQKQLLVVLVSHVQAIWKDIQTHY